MLLNPPFLCQQLCNIPKEVGVHTTADDFKQIQGIGPAIERRLHEAGIITFSQLSEMSPEELATLFAGLTGLSVERIQQKNWIGQARQMAADKELVEAAIEPAVLEGRQHYAVFTVEILLDEENIARRTRVKHVQSQGEDAWAGWEEPRLNNFFVERAGLNISQSYEASQEDRQPIESAPTTHAETGVVAPATALGGDLRLGEIVLKAIATEQPVKPIYSDQPFRAELILDLADVQTSREYPLDYYAAVYAKRWGSTSRQLVGRTDGRLVPADRFSLEVMCSQLPRGVYRMDAFVKLSTPGEMAKPGSGLMAMTEGGILQIY